MSVSLRRDILILACAVSAGIHGALAPDHFSEGAGAGAGFVGATAVLALLAIGLTRRPGSELGLMAAALTLGGLLASYGFAVTTGLPLLHPEPEPVDGLALATKAIEAVGLVVATTLWRPLAGRHQQTTTERNLRWTRHGFSARSRSL